jgi:formamidopyrimidine-DNA glycosylase
MPELPEVETTRLGIAPYIEGQIIQQVIVRQQQLRWPIPSEISQNLIDLSIKSISRRGKYLLLATSAGTIILHLGMSGSLRILPADTTILKHDHVDIIFRNGIILRYNDPRRFGTILWSAKPINQHFLLKDLGVEPLLDELTGDYLYQLSRNRKIPVKSFIMDSHVVVGVGNIYANEALYLASIRPTRPAGQISLLRYRALSYAIKDVLTNALHQGGTTLRNFVNASGTPGYFKQQLQAYGRGGMPCRTCEQPLREIRINNRSTIFCPSCQK